MSERLLNQKLLLNPELLEKASFVVVGAGAIGSFFATTLAKMGAKKITVYDHDTIEEHNISNQIYPISSVGQAKVEALSTMVISLGDCLIKTVKDKWTPKNAVECDVIVSAVDDMDARAAIWNYYCDKSAFFIDGRMAAMVYKVYGVDLSDVDARLYYSKTLHTNAQSEQERCGEKSIIFTVLGVVNSMLNQVKQYLMKEYRPTEVIADMYNHKITTKFHMEEKHDTITVEEVAA